MIQSPLTAEVARGTPHSGVERWNAERERDKPRRRDAPDECARKLEEQRKCGARSSSYLSMRATRRTSAPDGDGAARSRRRSACRT